MRTLQIPDKSLFKLNEVCGLTGVKPYVLRFWENEFEEIDPIVSSSGQKLYEHKDIEAIALIKKLLFEDKMSIEETKEEIKLASPMDLQEEKVPESPVWEEQEPTPSTQNIHSWSESEMEKLIAARENLQRLLEMTDSLKDSYDRA